MNHSKEMNESKSISLLKEFIEKASLEGGKKGAAIMALNHLQRITAGAQPPVEAKGCVYELRIIV